MDPISCLCKSMATDMDLDHDVSMTHDYADYADYADYTAQGPWWSSDDLQHKLRTCRRTAAQVLDTCDPVFVADIRAGKPGLCMMVLGQVGHEVFDADDVAYLLSQGGVFSSDDVRTMVVMGAPLEAIERVLRQSSQAICHHGAQKNLNHETCAPGLESATKNNREVQDTLTMWA